MPVHCHFFKWDIFEKNKKIVVFPTNAPMSNMTEEPLKRIKTLR